MRFVLKYLKLKDFKGSKCYPMNGNNMSAITFRVASIVPQYVLIHIVKILYLFSHYEASVGEMKKNPISFFSLTRQFQLTHF